MNENQTAARDKIMRLLLALPSEEREDVFAEIRYNGIFCPLCGTGSYEKPNPSCQCSNDE